MILEMGSTHYVTLVINLATLVLIQHHAKHVFLLRINILIIQKVPISVFACTDITKFYRLKNVLSVTIPAKDVQAHLHHVLYVTHLHSGDCQVDLVYVTVGIMMMVLTNYVYHVQQIVLDVLVRMLDNVYSVPMALIS